MNTAHVDPLKWAALNVDEKEKLAFTLAEYCGTKNGVSARVEIYSYQSGKKLAAYSALGFKVE
jgi:hypothetical protein